MSLEIAVNENTAAIRELIATISRGTPTTSAQVAAVTGATGARASQETVEGKAPNGTSGTPADSSRPADAVAQEPAPSEKAPADGAEGVVQMSAERAKQALHGHASAPADAPTYQQAAAAVLAVDGEKGRAAAKALLAKFGAASLPEVKPERFAAVIAAAAQALEVTA